MLIWYGNYTINYTARTAVSNSNGTDTNRIITASPFLQQQFYPIGTLNNTTSSKWKPYFNMIGFYGEKDFYPLMVAKLPQSIRKSSNERGFIW